MARKLSKIIWYMLKSDTLFYPSGITDPHFVQTAGEMIAEADDAASIPTSSGINNGSL